MSIKKATLASLILFSLTACSSGGSGGSSSNVEKPNAQPQTTEQQANKAAAEKAEADSLAAEKAAQEKAEADRLEAEKAAQEEADRLAAEKSIQDKANELRNLALKAGFSDVDAEQFAEDNINQDPNAYLSYLGYIKFEKVKQKALEAGLSEEQANQLGSEYSRVNANIADANQDINVLVTDKLSKEKAEEKEAEKKRLAAEKAEAKRLAEEQARQTKVAQLKPIAIEAGLDESMAESLAYQNSSKTPDEFKKIAQDYKEQQEIDIAKGFSKSEYTQGFNYEGYSPSASNIRSCVNFDCSTWSGTTDSGKTIYNQKYSVVMGDYTYRNGRENGYLVNVNSFNNVEAKGLKTPNDAIPTEGSATYTGKAFRAKETGELTYTVNFQDRSGEGKVTGLNVGTVNLDKGQIENARISATIDQDEVKTYSLEFFGPKVEEIGGSMHLGNPDNYYGLAGTRGEIQK